MIPLRVFCLLAALALAGCATGQDFPSLAPRPIERVAIAGEAESPPAPDAASEEPVSSEIAVAVAAAEAGTKDFDAQLALARSAIGRAQGAPQGSEAWVLGVEALSRLETMREKSAAALAAIDAVAISESGASAALVAARDRIAALDRRQGEAIATLLAILPQP